MNQPAHTPPTRHHWGSPPVGKAWEKPAFLDEMLLEFPDPRSIPQSFSYDETAREENLVSYLRMRHNEQRHRLLDRHESEYKKSMAEHERCIDDESFKLDHDPLDPAATMCAESYALASTSAAKEALVRLPESRRNVLVCIDQIKPGSPPETEQARRGEVTVVEFASIIAKMALEERRQMLNEMEEMRMFHFDSSILLYQALIRRNPEKFGSKKTGGTSMSVGGPKPVQPYQQAPTAYNTGPNPNQGNIAASAYHGLLFTQPPPPPVARDPRLPPAPQDPRRDYRR